MYMHTLIPNIIKDYECWKNTNLGGSRLGMDRQAKTKRMEEALSKNKKYQLSDNDSLRNCRAIQNVCLMELSIT